MRISKKMLKEMISEEMSSGVDTEMAKTLAQIATHDSHFLDLLKAGEIDIKTVIKEASQQYLEVYMNEMKKDLFNPKQIEYTAKLLEKHLNGGK